MKTLTSVLFLFSTLVFSVATTRAQGLPDMPQSNFPESPRDTKPFDPTPYPKPEARVLKEGLLAPNEFDVAEHQYLLNQPKTGLIRLLPRESNDWEVYKVEKKLE